MQEPMLAEYAEKTNFLIGLLNDNVEQPARDAIAKLFFEIVTMVEERGLRSLI